MYAEEGGIVGFDLASEGKRSGGDGRVGPTALDLYLKLYAQGHYEKRRGRAVAATETVTENCLDADMLR